MYEGISTAGPNLVARIWFSTPSGSPAKLGLKLDSHTMVNNNFRMYIMANKDNSCTNTNPSDTSPCTAFDFLQPAT